MTIDAMRHRAATKKQDGPPRLRSQPCARWAHNKEGARCPQRPVRECSAPAALLMLAFELGSTKWVLGFTTAPAQRPRVRTITAGDLPGLTTEILLTKAQFRLPLDAPVRSCAWGERREGAAAPGSDNGASVNNLRPR